MKRLLVVLLGLAAMLVPLLSQQTASHAEPVSRAASAAPAPISGRLFVGSVPVAGATVQLRASAGGAIIGSTTTNSQGRFWVTRTGPLPRGGAYVRIGATAIGQPGVVGGTGTPKWVEPSYTYGTRYGDGTALGRVNTIPAYVRGQVVDARTLRPVGGARVNLRRASGNTVAVTVVTGPRGYFNLRNVRGEDFNLQVLGRRVGYENGYRACNRQLVPTIGAACATPIGAIGRVFADS
jgi:hypothetical protein